MKVRRVLLTLLVLAAAGLVWYFLGGSRTPAGQPPLARLTPGNFRDLQSAFNAAAGAPRIIVMLSPT
jgi:hypothetical protein